VLYFCSYNPYEVNAHRSKLREEYLVLSRKLYTENPGRTRLHLALASSWHGLLCKSKEQQVEALQEAYNHWRAASTEGPDARRLRYSNLFYEVFEVLWQDLVDLDRDTEAIQVLRDMFPLARYNGPTPTVPHRLRRLGKRILLLSNPHHHAVEIFSSFVSRAAEELQGLKLPATDPADSMGKEEVAEDCLLCIFASVLAGDKPHADLATHLLIRCKPFVEVQSGRGELLEDSEDKRRLQLWLRFLPSEPMASQAKPSTWVEELGGDDRMSLKVLGVLDKLQLFNVLVTSEFQAQLGLFLRKAMALFGDLRSAHTLELKISLELLLDTLSLIPPVPKYTPLCESIASLLVEVANVIGRSSSVLHDNQLWATFLVLLDAYSSHCSDRLPSIFEPSVSSFGATSPYDKEEVSLASASPLGGSPSPASSVAAAIDVGWPSRDRSDFLNALFEECDIIEYATARSDFLAFAETWINST
jgi:hypothetical protein